MYRDMEITLIAGRYWVRVVGSVMVPFPDGKFYRVFDNIEDAVAFRKEMS